MRTLSAADDEEIEMSITHEANVPSAEPTAHDVAPDPRSVEAAIGAPATQFGVAPINRLLTALQTADSVDHVAVALEESIELIGGAQSVVKLDKFRLAGC